MENPIKKMKESVTERKRVKDLLKGNRRDRRSIKKELKIKDMPRSATSFWNSKMMNKVVIIPSRSRNRPGVFAPGTKLFRLISKPK